MAILDHGIKRAQHARAAELLSQGLTTRQISERTGLSQRAVLRLKKKLESNGTRTVAEHAQGTS